MPEIEEPQSFKKRNSALPASALSQLGLPSAADS